MRTLQWNARRQKKLSGEEHCKRCGNFDVNEPCLGKTDCSVCHSSTGVFCRACLKVRYSEVLELEEGRDNKEWMCPHCIEAKAINPYWICNSSPCLKKRNIAPTGIAIFRLVEIQLAKWDMNQWRLFLWMNSEEKMQKGTKPEGYTYGYLISNYYLISLL